MILASPKSGASAKKENLTFFLHGPLILDIDLGVLWSLKSMTSAEAADGKNPCKNETRERGGLFQVVPKQMLNMK